MSLSVIHDPYAGAGSYERAVAAAHRERQARIAMRAKVHPQPAPQQIEIREEPAVETKIEITTLSGQVVIISKARIDEARATFEKITKFPGGAKTTITKIQTAVCLHFGIDRTDLLSARRTKKVIIPRHVAMYLCKTLTFKSLPEIGRHFGGRDHTTALSAIRKVQKLCRKDWTIAHDVAFIEAALS